MPRNVNGDYTLPLPPVIAGEVIESNWANSTLDDIGLALTDSLDRYGRGGMLAPFKFFDGTANAPGAAWENAPGTGFWRGTGGLSLSWNGATIWTTNSTGLQMADTKKIFLPNPPTGDTEATNKKYVDDLVENTPPLGGPYLPLAGGTVTGLLVAAGNLQIGDSGSLIYEATADGDIGFRHDTDGPYWQMFSNGNFKALNGSLLASDRLFAESPGSDFAGWFKITAVEPGNPKVHFQARDDGGLVIWDNGFANRMLTLTQSGSLYAESIFSNYGFMQVGNGFNNTCEISYTRSGRAAIGLFYASDGIYGLWDNGALAGSRFTSDASGNFAARGNVTAGSDERLKENWEDFELTLDQIADLRTATFDRKDTKVRQVGVSAQQLQRIVPLAVVYNESEGFLSADYGRAALVMVANLAREVRRALTQ